MNKTVISGYVGEAIRLIEEGKIIKAHKELCFAYKEIESDLNKYKCNQATVKNDNLTINKKGCGKDIEYRKNDEEYPNDVLELTSVMEVKTNDN